MIRVGDIITMNGYVTELYYVYSIIDNPDVNPKFQVIDAIPKCYFIGGIMSLDNIMYSNSPISYRTIREYTTNCHIDLSAMRLRKIKKLIG